jgi:hypothetical protein
MRISIYVVGILGAFFSTLILTYVSIATMFGPFIAPVLVLLASMLFRSEIARSGRKMFEQELAIVQAIGSVGGMIAIAIGFTLPTLYFLAPESLMELLQTPFTFSWVLGLTVIVAGLFGLWLGKIFLVSLMQKSNLKFPVSIMVHETIVAQDHEDGARLLIKGSLFSIVTCMARDGLKLGKTVIPSVFSWVGLSKNIIVFPAFFGKELVFSVMPMVWAIGFTAGISIVLPLLVGMLSKYLVVAPLNLHAQWVPSGWALFAPMKDESFLTAFCSGLVLAEFAMGMLKYPLMMHKWCLSMKQEGSCSLLSRSRTFLQNWMNVILGRSGGVQSEQVMHWYDSIEAPLTILASVALLWHAQFSLFSILFLLVGTGLVTYNICYMAGKIGLVAFGRFVTFVMLPSLFLFSLTSFQITWLCLFSAIAMATASNFLFSVKVGELQDITAKAMHRYTLLGIIATALVAGFFFWVLCQHFELGSAELFAQRGRSRALLIQSFHFDWMVLLLGFLYGYLLKFFKLSPTMVFGGLLMPNNLTIGLLVGAVINYIFYNNKTEHPFWSGMLAGDTLWEFFLILCRMIG